MNLSPELQDEILSDTSIHCLQRHNNKNRGISAYEWREGVLDTTKAYRERIDMLTTVGRPCRNGKAEEEFRATFIRAFSTLAFLELTCQGLKADVAEKVVAAMAT